MPTNLTAYQQWQVDRYGSYLPDGHCETESGTHSATDAAEWCDKMGEMELNECWE